MSTLEPPLPVPEDDALDAAASAVVDGVATPEEAALVAAAPDGQARVDGLRAVAGAVGQPVPDQDQAAAARALAAALDAFGADAADAAEATGDAAGPGVDESDGPAARPSGGRDHRATVTTLPPPPASASTARWLPRLSVVAAALLLLVAAGALVAGFLGGDNAVTMSGPAERGAGVATTPLSESFAAAATTPPDAAAAPAAGAGAGAAPMPTTIPPARSGALAPPPTALVAAVVDGGDVGTQTDVQALVQRAAAALDSPPDAATTASGAALPSDVQACVSAGRAGEPVGALRYRAVGSFRGTPAVVLAYDRPGTPPRLLLVLARQGCTRLAAATF